MEKRKFNKMKDENRFIIQNAGWAALHPKDATAARRAIREYKQRIPHCELTGITREVQTHHIVPIWADPSKAADPDNLINLSARCNIHHIFGHDGNFRTKYVDNIREIADNILKLKEQSIVVERQFEASMSSNNSTWYKRIFQRISQWLKNINR